MKRKKWVSKYEGTGEDYMVTVLGDGRCVDVRLVRLDKNTYKWLATCNAIPNGYFFGDCPNDAVDGLLYVESVGVDELINGNGR